MTQCNNLNVKLPSSQFNKKKKSGVKNVTEVTLNLLLNVVGDSHEKTNFPHKLLLNEKQAAKLHKAFANNLSTNIKSWKTQLSKIVQLGEFLVRLLGPLLKIELPLMKNVLKSLAKGPLIPLGLTAAASAADI